MSVQFPAVRFQVQHWYHTLVLIGSILMFLGATVKNSFADNTTVFLFGWGWFLTGIVFWADKDSGPCKENPLKFSFFIFFLALGIGFIIYAVYRLIPGDFTNCDLIKTLSNSSAEVSDVPKF